MALGKRIESIRSSKGWRQQELCDRVNALVPPGEKLLTQQALSPLENRDSTSSEFVVKLALALGVSVLWLQDGEGEATAPDWPFSHELRKHVSRLRGDDLRRAENALRAHLDLGTLVADVGNVQAA